jgi:hypothetical protein
MHSTNIKIVSKYSPFSFVFVLGKQNKIAGDNVWRAGRMGMWAGAPM